MPESPKRLLASSGNRHDCRDCYVSDSRCFPSDVGFCFACHTSTYSPWRRDHTFRLQCRWPLQHWGTQICTGIPGQAVASHELHSSSPPHPRPHLQLNIHAIIKVFLTATAVTTVHHDDDDHQSYPSSPGSRCLSAIMARAHPCP